MSRAKAEQAKTEFVTVFPIAVAALPGVTARPTIADEATTARLVASRAFTYDAPTGPAEVEVTAFDEAERPALDNWVSPVAHGDHYKNPKPDAAPAAEATVDEQSEAAADAPADS